MANHTFGYLKFLLIQLKLEVERLEGKNDILNEPTNSESSIVNSVEHIKVSVNVEEEEWSQSYV